MGVTPGNGCSHILRQSDILETSFRKRTHQTLQLEVRVDCLAQLIRLMLSAEPSDFVFLQCLSGEGARE